MHKGWTAGSSPTHIVRAEETQAAGMPLRDTSLFKKMTREAVLRCRVVRRSQVQRRVSSDLGAANAAGAASPTPIGTHAHIHVP